MPAEGFVTDVPVDKVGVKTDKRTLDQRKLDFTRREPLHRLAQVR